jgi:AcrR family transcriptional regulator
MKSPAGIPSRQRAQPFSPWTQNDPDQRYIPAPKSSAKRTRRKEARPGEIIEAAITIFVQHGFAAARLEDVARLAGVSKGTLFVYFATKEELFRAVAQHLLAMNLASMQQIAQAPDLPCAISCLACWPSPLPPPGTPAGNGAHDDRGIARLPRSGTDVAMRWSRKC